MDFRQWRVCVARNVKNASLILMNTEVSDALALKRQLTVLCGRSLPFSRGNTDGEAESAGYTALRDTVLTRSILVERNIGLVERPKLTRTWFLVAPGVRRPR
jgi:hypothetical protein